MDRLEDLLRRIRIRTRASNLLLAAPREDRGHVAQQLRAVLSSLIPGFERAASLVLLALLCTTLMAVA